VDEYINSTPLKIDFFSSSVTCISPFGDLAASALYFATVSTPYAISSSSTNQFGVQVTLMKWKNLEAKVDVFGSVSLKLKVTVLASAAFSLLGDDYVEDVVDSSSSLLIK
jgi:hypothetical protein